MFEGIGQIPGSVNIKLKEDHVPNIQYNKRIPYTLHKSLMNCLDSLEKNEIIEKVNYPTDWVNNLLLVEKRDKSLRICLDPRPLNNNICREHFLIPTAETIISQLTGKNIFTVIDMKEGFWQLSLDKTSSDLCTFSTPYGRYKFLRMPFGLSIAPEIFQKKLFQIFGDINGVNIYFDDIIISASTEIEHDQIVEEVFNRAIKNNIKFNFAKLQFKLSEVKFLGQIISEHGIRPDDKNIRAIQEIQSPKNKKELLRILGMLKFFSKFIPNLSKNTNNLRNLTKNNVEFIWCNEHENELNYLKQIITNKPILQIFNPKKQITIQCDSSSKGLGTCLLQDN